MTGGGAGGVAPGGGEVGAGGVAVTSGALKKFIAGVAVPGNSGSDGAPPAVADAEGAGCGGSFAVLSAVDAAAGEVTAGFEVLAGFGEVPVAPILGTIAAETSSSASSDERVIRNATTPTPTIATTAPAMPSRRSRFDESTPSERAG